MRKHFLTVITIFSLQLFFYSCQDIIDLEIISFSLEREIVPGVDGEYLDFEDIMELRDNRFAQGGDCWGEFFFQFFQNNFQFRVYNLNTKELVQTVSIPSSEAGFVSNCHCNTVCFGSEFYDKDDVFPLLYVSTGYSSDGYTGALVYRITQSNNRFSISLVQTLKFPVDKSSWTEFVPGEKSAYLCYTSERVIFRFEMPKLSDGDVVVLSRNAALETFQFTPQPDWMFSSRNQDRLFYKGRILYITGVPLSGEASALVVLDLDSLKRERIFDFSISGLTTESESIFVWQDNLCVAFADRIVKLVF